MDLKGFTVRPLDADKIKIIFPPSLEVIKKTNETLLERLSNRLTYTNQYSILGDIFVGRVFSVL